MAKKSAAAPNEIASKKEASEKAEPKKAEPLASRLLVVSSTPTPHVIGPDPKTFFAEPLDEATAACVIPLARLDGRELGLPVAAVPMVYHESFTLSGAIEIEPRGEGFVLHLPPRARLEEIDGAEDTLENLQRIGHVALEPIPHPPEKLEWSHYRDASNAVGDRLGEADTERLDELGTDPVIGHAGANGLWIQGYAPKVSGDFVFQIETTELGLVDIVFYVYWDAAKNRFFQVQQFS